jgi:arsenate reductase
MNEVGVDISQQTSDALASKDLAGFDYVVTLCGDARDHCPSLPSGVSVEHWDLPDPAAVRGYPEEVQRSFRIVRYQLEKRVKVLLKRVL